MTLNINLMIYISKGNVMDTVVEILSYLYYSYMSLLAYRPTLSKISDDQMALSW